MRIAIVPKSYPAMAPFGSVRGARMAALALQRLGVSVEVVTADLGPDTSAYRWDTVTDADGVTVTRALPGTVVSPRQVIWRALLARGPFDAVLITQPGHFGQSAITAARHWGVPALVHLSGPDVLQDLFAPDWAPFLIWTLGKATAVAAATAEMAELAPPFTTAPVAVWPEPHLTAVAPPPRPAVEALWALPQSPLRIGLPGPFAEGSGFVDALAAFGMLRRDHPAATLLVIGTLPIPHQHQLATWQQGDPDSAAQMRAVPTAEDEDLSALCRACDQIWLPWEVATTTAPLTAAMAAGAPVITTTVPALAALVADDETGLLVAPGDGHALAAAAKRLVAEPERAWRLGTAAQARWAAIAGFDPFVARMS
ncbi:MAG: glycosyltransferase family 4 protein, partial [Candidatus Sericytochromatia bacterium]|nr:glycosyltransferase family 4 protein [Candidatus Sericytochromatia bacterium]